MLVTPLKYIANHLLMFYSSLNKWARIIKMFYYRFMLHVSISYEDERWQKLIADITLCFLYMCYTGNMAASVLFILLGCSTMIFWGWSRLIPRTGSNGIVSSAKGTLVSKVSVSFSVVVRTVILSHYHENLYFLTSC